MKKRELLRNPATQLAFMTGAALVHTAWKDHRAKTHRSIELSKPVDFAMDVFGGPFTDTTRWAATHRIHHHTPDTNLVPWVKYADLQEWFAANPHVAARYDQPTLLSGMDPAMQWVTHDDAMEVGGLAKELLAGKYVPQQNYSDQEIRDILYGTEPRYYYEHPHGDMDAVPTIDGFHASIDDIRFIARDPHSPVLCPDGMRNVMIYNMPLYQDVVKFYERNPQYMPSDLTFTKREQWIEDHKKAVRLGFVATNIAARIIAERPRTPGETAKSALRGAVVSGIGTLALIAGGNIVNSLGHGGGVNFGSKQFIKDLKDGTVRVKDNGTYTTNNVLLSPPTLGEVGGQFEHHEDPSLIAYTHEKGIKKALVDPFGALTEFLAKHNVGMRVGPGFEGRRPDLPSDAVLAIERKRREYRAKN